MSKLNLTDLSTITGNETSAINTINNNNALTETFSDNTISRDGTSPNQMLSDLDMNSNRVLNLPVPVSAAEPLRLQDLSDFIGTGTITAGAPTNASYVTLGTNVTLTNERVLTAGTNITLTDAGAGSTLTAATTANLNPPSNDGGALGTTALKWSDLFLADGGVINWNSSNALITHSAPNLIFGASNCQYSGNVRPSTNGVGTLGTSGLGWGSLFLASGGVLNFNAGDVTVTHSAGALTSNATWSQTGAMTILSGTSFPAGGTAGAGYKFSSNSGLGMYFGSGAPTLSAAQGSLYLRTDGGANTRLYSNNNGTTGWSPMTG